MFDGLNFQVKTYPRHKENLYEFPYRIISEQNYLRLTYIVGLKMEKRAIYDLCTSCMVVQLITTRLKSTFFEKKFFTPQTPSEPFLSKKFKKKNIDF